MADPNYDPAERHRRYEESKKLKGRGKGTGSPPRTPEGGGRRPPPKGTTPTTHDTPQQATARVARLKGKIASLEGALTEALTALAEKRRSAAKTEKESSDGKTTVKERQQAKESRDKHQTENASEAKKAAASKGGSASAKARDAATMSVDELETRVSNIRAAISTAKRQLSAAQSAAGLSHSDSTAIEMYRDAVKHMRSFSAPPQRKESVQMTADFGGYATRHDVQCADGRTIKPGAFKANDGMVVPLVYMHGHTSVENVLGHCKLEYRDDGVYAHAYFNQTTSGQSAKEQVRHGDLKFLSIFANRLREKASTTVQHARDVIEGNIKEVSLVIAGANPGAFIDVVNFSHSEGKEAELGFDADEAIITTGLELELVHADTDVAETDEKPGKTLTEVLDTLNEEQARAVNFLLENATDDTDVDVKHSDTEEVDAEDGVDADQVADETPATDVDVDVTVNVDETATDNADVDADAPADADASTDTDTTNEAGDDVQHDNTQEDNSMTHNVFDQAGKGTAHQQVTLSHADVEGIVSTAMKNGSLKDAVEGYVLAHGIENIDYLFPDSQLLENSPAFISRRMEWVDKVLSSVRKSPFSRIKTITADITPDEARARGYIKGNMKNEEFFALSKRETTPQTVYKKQKLDRDDVVDIVNLDVVAWLKAEMKVMLDEEIAGAILVGDGRSIGDDDKIKETNIRPIASDAELYVTTVNVNLDDASSSIEELVDAVINNRKYYKGSGQPTFFTTESVISQFLTVKDNFGRRIYGNLAEVAAVLRVSEIVPVEVMERVPDLVGIMVNLADYTLGADKGGQATMFDDFDIDYNKLRYLIETRLSGALTTPKAALVFRKVAAASVLVVPVEPTFSAHTVTVPTVTGLTYKNFDTNATLVTGTPIVLTEGQSLHVIAVPGANKHTANNAEDEWTFTYGVNES